MSDMMSEGMPQGPGVQQKMSVFNPTDMAAKATTGAVRPGMTIGEFLQKNFGVSPNDPIEKLVEATKGQMQNRTMAGKMGMPGAQRSIPTAAPQAPPRPPASGGLEGLMNKLG